MVLFIWKEKILTRFERKFRISMNYESVWMEILFNLWIICLASNVNHITFVLDICSKVAFQSIHLHLREDNYKSVEICSLMVKWTQWIHINEPKPLLNEGKIRFVWCEMRAPIWLQLHWCKLRIADEKKKHFIDSFAW